MEIFEDIIFVGEEDEKYLDHDDYETICESRYVDYPDVDAWFEKGWCFVEGEFRRSDTDHYDSRYWKSFRTRYRLEDFKLSKSLRRVLNKNTDLKSVIRPCRINSHQSKLYEKHYVRYGEKPYETLARKYANPSKYPTKDMELCIYKNRRLIAASFFEVAGRSIQSNSAIWDLDEPKRSLGILTVLLEMQYAIRRRKKFYYLGHYLKQNPNYQYKLRFPGLEFYDWDNDVWVDKEDADELLNQKLKRKEVLPPFDYEFLYSLFPLPARHSFPDISAMALFGSRANNSAREGSDIDVLIVTNEINQYFEDDDLLTRWGSFRYARREKWFSGETIRAFYREGNCQIEFNFVSPDWADQADSTEIKQLLNKGLRILCDKDGILEKLQNRYKS